MFLAVTRQCWSQVEVTCPGRRWLSSNELLLWCLQLMGLSGSVWFSVGEEHPGEGRGVLASS